MSLTPPMDNTFLTSPLDGEPLVPSSIKSCEDIICMWENCQRTFDDPELLYNHLANDHVGRKSTGNLCLVCHWNGCGNSSKKRDHITSHLRVHVSSKPHTCERCKKAFKRPQDLKKHEKTHTPQHQKKIFDSKITRIKNQPLTPPQLLPDDSPGTSSAPSPQLPCSPSSAASDSPVYPLYPIPHHCVPQFDSVESDIFGSDYVKLKNSQKRSMEVFEEFYQDVKKQRVDPKYNDALIEKLEGISDALEDNIDQLSLPPSLRKKEDLNILEDFFTQALHEIESNPNTYPTTALPYVPNIGYPLDLEGNIIDNGDSYNNHVVGNAYPRTYNDVYVGSIPSPPEEYVNSIPIQSMYIINNPNVRQSQPVPAYINPDNQSFMTHIRAAELLQAGNEGPEIKSDPVKTEPQVSNESSTPENHIDSTETSHKVSKIDVAQNGTSDDDIVDKLSALSINAPPNPKSNLYNDALKKKHIALINAIRREVANLSRQLDETLVKPDDKDHGEVDSLSNSPGDSSSTQPVSEGDKLNLGAESLVAIE